MGARRVGREAPRARARRAALRRAGGRPLKTGDRSTARAAAGLLVAWLAAAVAVSATGLLARAGPPFPQVLLAALTIAIAVLGLGTARGRALVAALPDRALLAVHLTRFVGVWFLVLHEQGRLPYAFAVPGGIGDIAAATLALALMLPRRAPGVALLAWNLFGLVDILFVVATAARLGLSDPASMAELLVLPLALLPTFVVPLIVFSHVAIGWRLLR